MRAHKIKNIKKYRFKLLPVVSYFILCGTSFSQNYSWAHWSSGDSPGLYADGEEVNFGWEWILGAETIAGTGSILRTGAGTHYFGAETIRQTILAEPGFIAPEFDLSPFAVSVGGVTGIYNFASGGEIGRALNDAPAAGISTTVFQFVFSPGRSSPPNTLIELFDPGAGEAGVSGPFTYDFTASLAGIPIDTSLWSVQIIDPYSPAGNSTTGITWNGNSIIVPSFLNGAFSGQNYPDTLVFLDTKTATFDNLMVKARGLNVDNFSIGFGANAGAQPVPHNYNITYQDGMLKVEYEGNLHDSCQVSWPKVLSGFL